MMTKKHFKAIAEILSEGFGMNSENFECIVSSFSEFCAGENPNFNRVKFREACFKERVIQEALK